MKLAFSKFLSLIGLITATWGPFAMAAEIQDLTWMSGQWAGTYQGLPMEAQYPSGSGGMVLGLTKIANGKETEFFEFEEIVEVGNSLVLRPMPFAKKGVEFALKEVTGTRVVFENPAHDFPTKIIYELKQSGELL